MKPSRIGFWLALCVVVVVGCASDTGSGTTGTSAAHLTVANLTPVPCFSGKPDWELGLVELLTADALAACSYDGTNGTAVEVRLDDAYLNSVRDAMIQLGAITLAQWVTARGNGALNCDPVTGQSGIPVAIESTPVRERLIWPGLLSTDPLDAMVRNANSDIRAAGLNLCIAQHLRAASPGASGGEALLLSEAEQRQLLGVIRERAQISVIQYALLGVAFVRPFSAADLLPFDQSISQRPIPLIQLWSEVACANTFLTGSVCGLDVDPVTGDTTLEAMGKDFGTAIQLMLETSTEMASLTARSRSTRSASGSNAQSRADEVWGPASWYQRGLAVLYGGDALAVAANGPWQHPLGLQKPSQGWWPTADWPSSSESPYVRVETREPQIGVLLGLARRLDRLELKYGSSGQIEVTETATHLYDIVERFVRLEDCADPDPVTGACTFLGAVPADPASHVLWKKYRVTRAHAEKLAHLLADSIGDPTSSGAPGAQNIRGELEYFAEPNIPLPNTVYRLKGDAPGQTAAFSQRGLAQRIAPYQAFAPRRFPTALDLDPGARGSDQGFISTVSENVNEGKRTLGAVPALVAAREMLFSSLAYLQNTNASLVSLRQSYFAQSDRIIGLINGAVGQGSVTVRPMVERYTDTAGAYPLTRLRARLDVAGNRLWEVSVFFDPATGFAGLDTADEGKISVVAIPNQPWAGSLALNPSSQVLGKNIFGLAQVSHYNTDAHFNGATSKNQKVPGAESAPQRKVFSKIPLSGQQFWTFVRRRYPAADDQYRLLVDSVRLATDFAAYGQQFAGEGLLGGWADRQSKSLETNPVRPAYDGFGLPTDWVPPLNAKLLGAQDSSGSAEFYLAAAKEKSKEATAAVNAALENLLVEQSGEAELAAATAKALAALKEEAEALCGAGHTECDTTIGTFTPAFAGVFPAPTCPANGSDINGVLNCFVQDRVDAMNSLRPTVAKAVADLLQAPAAPQFEAYSGGSLQELFIEQWAALRAPAEHIAALHAASGAVQARIATAEAALGAADAVCQDNCSKAAMANAIKAGKSSSQSIGVSAGFPSGASVSTSYSSSYSPGPLIQQAQKCRDVCTQVAPAQFAQVESMLEAFSSLNAAAQGLSDAGARISLSGAAIAAALNETNLKRERAKLEIELTKTSQVTSYGLYRRYRSYDLWRAKALIENSRRHSLAARRAIEARYVVDLSDLSAPEAFVYNPASWADDVYSYDLSMPSAVGLSVGSPAAGGIYSSKLEDYVANLEGFIEGYAVTRPAAVAMKDIDVVTLPGLVAEPGAPPTGDGVPAAPTISPWMLLCPGGAGPSAGWKGVEASVPLDQTCGKDCDACNCGPTCSASCLDSCSKYVRPARARLLFSLDPWGRKDGGIADPPYEKRFNARWSQLAVNFVGTGVLDCQKAKDPPGCYSQAFIRFDLRHVGPPWITDYDGAWRTLAVPLGAIEAGKALAAELWLDPLKDGWDTSYISAVARTELANRPFGGAYALEFEVKPETRLDRIERVQILSGQEYWVKQQ